MRVYCIQTDYPFFGMPKIRELWQKLCYIYSGVTCHFSLHAELPFRGKMEWIFIPFYPCRVEWTGHAIPFYPFPVHISLAPYFPMQNMCPFVFAMGKYIAFYIVLITELVTIPEVVVVIVVVQLTCNHNCSHIF